MLFLQRRYMLPEMIVAFGNMNHTCNGGMPSLIVQRLIFTEC